MLKRWLEQRWYGGDAPLVLQPLSALYGRISEQRRTRLQQQQPQLAVPVIIVGNISVGGTGKTPFVIWLVDALRSWGFRPGVISRGYGGLAPAYPLRVDQHTNPDWCGDEPLLIATRTQVPVAVAPDRLAAARLLIQSGDVDVLIADDGLQHYRLPRQIEFCVVDGRRGLGNGALLPAGPLRESPQRLDTVDFVVVNGEGFDAGPNALRFHLCADAPRRLLDDSLADFAILKSQIVHAVAGIGDPERFFSSLEAAGLQIERHAFNDHQRYRSQDLDFGNDAAVMMTEKDAVKCRAFAKANWCYWPVSAELSPADAERVRESCRSLLPAI